MDRGQRSGAQAVVLADDASRAGEQVNIHQALRVFEIKAIRIPVTQPRHQLEH